MNGVSLINIVAALLQLFVPSYALRLVRRFGAARVGWFVATAFICLALIHLLQPFRSHSGLMPGQMPNLVFALASGLLLIGMTHLETLLSERVQLKRQEKDMQVALEAKVAERTAELTAANRELLADIACREQKEKALRESETQYRYLFAEIPQPMWIFDLRSLKFLAVNQAALRHYGMDYPEFMSLTAKDLMPAGAVPAFLQDVAKPCLRAETRGVWQLCKKDLSVREMEITALDMKFGGCPARLVLAQDITQSRHRECQQMREQHSQIIGRVAGGFAHHFNNILTIIEGHSSLLLRDCQDPKITEQLGQISTAADRAATLTKQLIAAGGRQLIRPEPVDLHDVIRAQTQLFKRLVGERIEIKSSLAPTLPLVLAERRLLEHMLVHLVLNARDALADGGVIEIQTSSLRLNEAQSKRHPDAKVGEFVRINVKDNGCGMSPEVQAHLFEPFFTTHDIGRGTGLGLASIQGEVKQLSGWIEFSSEPGVGSEFCIFLPRAVKPAAEVVRPAAQAPAPARRGTILLVEPDDRARGVARFILNRQGYHVIEADCAHIALVLWEGQSGNIDLVITDTSLGDTSGREFVDGLRATRPDLKVLFTAHPPAEGAENVERCADEAEFAKPYTPDKLLQAVQAAWPTPLQRASVKPAQPACVV